MLKIPDAPVIGGTSHPGLWVSGAVCLGRQKKSAQYYLFLQNDTANNPVSPWYVAKIDDTHYAMPGATAPKGSQYIGAFLWDAESDTRRGRIDADARWTTTDATVVRINSVTAVGQAIISMLRAGSAVLTVEWGGMSSTLSITAI